VTAGEGAAALPRRIRIDNGPDFACSPSEDTLLRGALRAGIRWPYECSVGGCGACRFELLQGDVADIWPQAPGLSARERQRGKRLACQSRALGDLQVRVRLDANSHRAIAPRRMQARLASVHPLSHDMAMFDFCLPGEAPFWPGQYALVYLPGVTGARAYSMCNLPEGRAAGESSWQVIVRRMPGGSGSTALFERVEPGQTVTVDGPFGHAYLDAASERDIVCIAGGSGLGPMLSIARAALHAPGARRVQLFIGLRSEADLGCLSALAELDDARLQVTPVLSNLDASAPWQGARGFVHDEVARRLGSACDRFDFYFAGPPPMVEAVQQMLMVGHQVPFDRIHFDRFV
jgi:toluene monooxygenase electron transfer component